MKTSNKMKKIELEVMQGIGDKFVGAVLKDPVRYQDLICYNDLALTLLI